MRELTFIGPLSGPNIGIGRQDTGETKKLLLIAEDGTEFQLKVDQRLASVVAREFGGPANNSSKNGASDTIDLTSSGSPSTESSLRPSVASTQPITPREVQDRVRAGDTAQEIAADTGADLAYVQRFASQVEAECEQVIAAAATCEVMHEGKRQSFEDAVVSRLRILGVAPNSVTWHALKAGHDWSVVLSYDTAKESAEAWFEYSLARRIITPSNEEAEWLLAQPHTQESVEPTSVVTPPVTTRATIQASTNNPPAQKPAQLPEPTNNAQLVEDSDQWDSEHPAAKAHKRREAAAANDTQASATPTRPQSHVDVSASSEPEVVIDDRDASAHESAIDETAQTSPEWEDLLFGSPSTDGYDS
ncbi:MAG: septation protein SepH [Candidatus Nanopelagicales bacterium]